MSQTNPTSGSITRRLTGLLITAFIVLPIAGIGWMQINSVLAVRRWNQSRGQLKEIGLALHQYHEQYGSFPPAYVRGPDEKPWHSWRVLLLPYLGEQELYAKYRFDEPWDGTHNREVLQQRPEVYRSDLAASNQAEVTTYVAVVSRRSMWPAHFSVRIQDVWDGSSNTIQLIEHTDSDIHWSEPRDLRERDALAALKSPKTAASNSAGDSLQCLFADGSTRRLRRNIGRGLFLGLLTPRSQAWTIADDKWPVGLLVEERPPAVLPDPRPMTDFPGTQVLCTPETAIQPRATLLYCATVQLAWDQSRPQPHQPAKVMNPTVISRALNEHPFPPGSLADYCYFAGHANLESEPSIKLFEQLREKFPSAIIRPLPAPSGLSGYRVMAYLEKSMPFAEPLDPVASPLGFPHGWEMRHVKSFGMESATQMRPDEATHISVVSIADYLSDDDFIVMLQTDSAEADQIILAKASPAATLQETWKAVAERIQRPKAAKVIANLRRKDHLQIPVISFGIDAELKELLGLRVEFRGGPAWPIVDARQTIRFRLDEYGAELVSDAQIIYGEFGEDPRELDRPRQMIFDKPFLLALRQRDAEAPYFLAWIGNADLMEPAK